MNIRKTMINELEILIEMYAKARSFMAAHGNPDQWKNGYPSRDRVIADIESGCSYVCEHDGRIIATFFYKKGDDATYREIFDGQWLNNTPYGVVHRITSDGTVKGAASFCFDWAFEQCGNLKIDTHKDNYIMQKMLEKNILIVYNLYVLKEKCIKNKKKAQNITKIKSCMIP